MKRPENHAYTDPCDAYLKVTTFANLAGTISQPRQDRTGSHSQIQVLGNTDKMLLRLHRFTINGLIVFPTVAHFVDALNAAGFICDSAGTNAVGDTTWKPTENPCKEVVLSLQGVVFESPEPGEEE